jgi:hypothetical protein
LSAAGMGMAVLNLLTWAGARESLEKLDVH